MRRCQQRRLKRATSKTGGKPKRTELWKPRGDADTGGTITSAVPESMCKMKTEN